jgi:hypothetical protein
MSDPDPAATPRLTRAARLRLAAALLAIAAGTAAVVIAVVLVRTALA